MAGSSVSRNINSIRTNLKNKQKDIQDAVYQTIQEIALDLGIKASDLAPIDTGRLRKSVNPEVIKSGSKIRANVEFSAKDPLTGYDYALIQHENLQFNHPKGGQAKYLEQALKQNEKEYKERVERAVKRGVN